MYVQEQGASKAHFHCRLKNDVKPYLVPSRNITYALQIPFRKEEERLWEQQILGLLGVDGTVELYNSYVTVPKSSVCLYLDPMRLKQALTRPVQRGSTINDTLTKLTNECFMILINVSLKIKKKSS